MCAREPGLEAYVLAIERQLGRWRGRELQLSPPDFQLAREWFRGGLPLAVVLAGVDDACGASRPARTLVACRRAVERLGGTATALHSDDRSAAEAPPEQLAVDALAVRLEQLAAQSSAFATVAHQAREAGPSLAALRDRVEQACLAALGGEEREALLSSARRALERQGRGLSAEARAAALERQLLRRALERFGLVELLCGAGSRP